MIQPINQQRITDNRTQPASLSLSLSNKWPARAYFCPRQRRDDSGEELPIGMRSADRSKSF